MGAKSNTDGQMPLHGRWEYIVSESAEDQVEPQLTPARQMAHPRYLGEVVHMLRHVSAILTAHQ